MSSERADIPSPRARKALFGFCFLLAAFGVGFMLFGEFGGWYYDGRGGHVGSEYDPQSEEYHRVWRGTGQEYWDSDGLFTEATLIAPLSIAIGALVLSMWCLYRATTDDAGRTTMRRAGMFAAIAALVIGGWAFMYAGSMDPEDEWWLGSAFYAGFINSVLLAVIAFASTRFDAFWNTDRPGADTSA